MARGRTPTGISRWFLGFLAVTASSACSGSEFTSDGSGSGGGAAGSAGSGGAVGSGATAGAAGSSCKGICVPQPDGWKGPVEILDVTGPEAPPCDAPYSTAQFLAHDQQTASPAVCTCVCDPTNVSCATQVQLDTFPSSGCAGSNLCASHALNTTNLCLGMPAGCSSVASVKLDINVSGSCSPKLVKKIEQPWNRSVRACQPESFSSCAKGVCVPSTDKPVCVYKDGTQACPSGYPNQITIFETEDDRDCQAECTCGPPRCGKLAWYSGEGCAGTAGGTIPVPSACAPVNSSAKSLKYSTDAHCPALTANQTATGTVSQTEITVCCNK